MMTTDNEFAYFDPKTLENWAGPNHWKFRASAKESVKDAEGAAKPKRKTKKKEPFFLNFDEDPEIDFETAIASSGRTATTLSSAILKKAQQTDNVLPPDVRYDVKMLTQLFNKPRWRVSLARRKAQAANNNTEGKKE